MKSETGRNQVTQTSAGGGWWRGLGGTVGANGGFVTQIQSTLSTPVTESHLFLPSRLHPWGGHGGHPQHSHWWPRLVSKVGG